MDQLREQYMQEYTDENILGFYELASRKYNFVNVHCNGDSVENNYIVNNERREYFINLYNNKNTNRNVFKEVLNSLTDEQLTYIGF